MSLYTVGIEEEYQIIDPKTKELIPSATHLITSISNTQKDSLKSEMHQSVLEGKTEVCSSISQLKEELFFLRKNILHLAQKHNVNIVASGTHPFSDWKDQLISHETKYETLVSQMRDVARSNLIFGLHIHVGIPDKATGFAIMNQAKKYLPILLGLAVNSPFWCGRNTGYEGYRVKIFDKFPRSGIPEDFESLEDYLRYETVLENTGCLDEVNKIWWDLRLHPKFPTIEFRICDVPLRAQESVCLAAICQALVAWIHDNLQKSTYEKPLPKYFINENKWRASRYGFQSELIDFSTYSVSPFLDHLNSLIHKIRPYAANLGSE
ncbi:MAG: carboxylate-amine ligase, partial [Leadbetterella sp.]